MHMRVSRKSGRLRGGPVWCWHRDDMSFLVAFDERHFFICGHHGSEVDPEAFGDVAHS